MADFFQRFVNFTHNQFEHFKIKYDAIFQFIADRAKQIKTTAKVNEDPTEKLIRELKEENEKLMEMLKKAQSGEAVKLSADDDDDDDDEGQKEGMSEEGKFRICYLGEFVYIPLPFAALLGEPIIKTFT